MFNKHMRYGLDERGPYSQPGLDVNALVDFLKAELTDNEERTQPAPEPDTTQALPPLPTPVGSNTLPAQVPFDVPDVLPGRSTGYAKALKELLNHAGKKYV
jgi:hypothetical protein